mmetsp:Transcript_15504/g.32731  ORF Transcript_15504/g.32731 Transcript_15504/m.32731 type:complete len:291 (-) Transcript_15504:144-1016(-)
MRSRARACMSFLTGTPPSSRTQAAAKLAQLAKPLPRQQMRRCQKLSSTSGRTSGTWQHLAAGPVAPIHRRSRRRAGSRSQLRCIRLLRRRPPSLGSFRFGRLCSQAALPALPPVSLGRLPEALASWARAPPLRVRCPLAPSVAPATRISAASPLLMAMASTPQLPSGAWAAPLRPRQLPTPSHTLWASQHRAVSALVRAALALTSLSSPAPAATSGGWGPPFGRLCPCARPSSAPLTSCGDLSRVMARLAQARSWRQALSLAPSRTDWDARSLPLPILRLGAVAALCGLR